MRCSRSVAHIPDVLLRGAIADYVFLVQMEASVAMLEEGRLVDTR